MKGATEYKGLFKRGLTQHGKLLISYGDHARGETMTISVIPCGSILSELPSIEADRVKRVEVYDVVSGQRGWTEVYGWVESGPWIDDFNALVDSLRAEKEKRELAHKEKTEQLEAERVAAKNSLLSNY